MKKKSEWSEFQEKLQKRLLVHPIIKHNEYTSWFAQGDFSKEQLEDFTVQFSVFSNLFLVAQVKKMIHSRNLEMMRASKEILASEIGVTFKAKKGEKIETDDFTLACEGSVDGGRFHFRAGHFEWLLDFAKAQGLSFSQLGRRSLGTKATLQFTDTLEELFGSEDPSISAGASFAIENWANKGFWKELISGLKKCHWDLPMGFFVWHDKVEDQHAQHTMDELEELFHEESIDQEVFIASGVRALNSLEIFWNGLLTQATCEPKKAS